MKRALLLFAVFATLMMGINPADYDPYHDNSHDTYSLLAAAFPQGDRDCWGSDKPCADGKYRDRQGNEQPDNCSNVGDGPEQNNCACNRAHYCPPQNANGEPPPPQEHENSDCKVYCRGDHCHCSSPCESMNHGGEMPANCPMNRG